VGCCSAWARPARLTLPKGAVCGGYNPKGTVGFGEFRGSLAAFLFTWPDGDVSVRPTKLQKVGGAGLACVDEPEHGPKFGADSLVIPLSSEGGNNPTAARNKLGTYYDRLPGGGGSIFAPGEPTVTTLTSLKVLVGVYAPGEEIPNSDAQPFALS